MERSPRSSLNNVQLVCQEARAAQALEPGLARQPQRSAAPCDLVPRPLVVARRARDGVVEVAVLDAYAAGAVEDAEVGVHEGDGGVGHGRVPARVGPGDSLPVQTEPAKARSAAETSIRRS